MIRLSLVSLVSLLSLSTALGDSATWRVDPLNGDWNLADNWTPATVPDGPTNAARFQASDITQISVNSQIEVDRVVFDSGAGAYSFTIEHFQWLILNGKGIINLSDEMQQFFVLNTAQLRFMNNASAGTNTTVYNRPESGGSEVNYTQFFDNSTASGGTFINEGSQDQTTLGASTQFRSESNAGNGVFINLPGINNGLGGTVLFWDNSNAANGTFTNHASPSRFAPNTLFFNTSSAGAGSFLNEGASEEGGDGGGTYFIGSSTAGQAVVTSKAGTVSGADGGFVEFDESSTAGEATLIALGGAGNGAKILFFDTSDGGTARVELFGNGFLDIASHSAGSVRIGSLEGDGPVLLGANNLTIGSNGMTTTFNGVSSGSGSITKTGEGTLLLSGPNTYEGGTTVADGALVVANQIGSGTGSGPVDVDAGSLGGSGIIAGAVTVGTGSGTGAFLTPGIGTSKQVTLTTQNALTFNSDATYTYTFKGNRNRVRNDVVIANGVTINGGTIAISSSSQNRVRRGMVLTVISNTSANPISGTFSNLPDGAIINVNGNNLQASYSGGDGNDLTLTVVP